MQRCEGACSFGETRMPNLKYSGYLKLLKFLLVFQKHFQRFIGHKIR